MKSIEIPEIIVAIICFIFSCYLTRHGLPRNWPILGMLPSLLVHVHRIHERCVTILERTGCTFHFQGPWFSNMDMLLTVDPSNVHYIMSTNFSNYPKGKHFFKLFDVLGSGIFNSDGDLWSFQRKMAQSIINHRRFHLFLAKATQAKVEKGLIPILEQACKHGLPIDMQDVFQRFTFDTTCILVTGRDPGSLSVDFPEVPFSRALDDAEEAIAFRHALPEMVWRMQSWLGLGPEGKMNRAWKILDQFIHEGITMKRAELVTSSGESEDQGVDLLTSYMRLENESTKSQGLKINIDDKFLRDSILNLMIAGRDTTSSALTWFFWLVSTNPRVENNIREELSRVLDEEAKWHVFGVEETKNLVYLHATFCESLRLYPPVPFESKSPIHPDILPSGHHVGANKRIIISLYAMGRMTAIWGKDALEFKPERWITEQGKIKHEPSYKFLAFNAGPRICIGKQVAFTELKMTAATLIHNYRFDVARGHRASPDVSVILHMKDGLMVNVRKRWT